MTGPTMPAASFAEGETAWRLVSHLSLNYLSLLGQDKEQGANAFRDLLRLYCRVEDEVAHKQIEGLCSVTAPTHRLHWRAGLNTEIGTAPAHRHAQHQVAITAHDQPVPDARRARAPV